VKVPLIALLLVPLLMTAPGCGNCPYGSNANGTGCKGRGPATDHESTGWHTPSMRKKVPVAVQKAGPVLVQATVNQYGELWAYTGDTDHVVLDVEGKQIKPKEEDSATGDTPFPSEKLAAPAMDHAMEYIRPRAPGYEFIKGELYVGDFGRDKGLWWHIETYNPEENAERLFLAAPSGAVRCEHLATGDGTQYARISGEGCPDQGF
jgi:hypothetical protein